MLSQLFLCFPFKNSLYESHDEEDFIDHMFEHIYLWFHVINQVAFVKKILFCFFLCVYEKRKKFFFLEIIFVVE